MADTKTGGAARELAPDDMDVGMLVTVIHGPILFRLIGEPEDESYHGDVMKIDALDFPFVVVSWPNRPYGGTQSFDLRCGRKFRRPTGEYVDAMLAEKARRESEDD